MERIEKLFISNMDSMFATLDRVESATGDIKGIVVENQRTLKIILDKMNEKYAKSKQIISSITSDKTDLKDFLVENRYYTSLDESQVASRSLNFLKNDLIGLVEKSLNIEQIGLRLIPSYLIDYSINATFSISVGVIHRINENSSICLSEDGKRVSDNIEKELCSQKNKISQFTFANLDKVRILQKGRFMKSFNEIRNVAEEVLVRTCTKTIVYHGANNVRYEKTCAPTVKQVSISNIKRFYIPFLEHTIFHIKEQICNTWN